MSYKKFLISSQSQAVLLKWMQFLFSPSIQGPTQFFSFPTKSLRLIRRPFLSAPSFLVDYIDQWVVVKALVPPSKQQSRCFTIKVETVKNRGRISCQHIPLLRDLLHTSIGELQVVAAHHLHFVLLTTASTSIDKHHNQTPESVLRDLSIIIQNVSA